MRASRASKRLSAGGSSASSETNETLATRRRRSPAWAASRNGSEAPYCKQRGSNKTVALRPAWPAPGPQSEGNRGGRRSLFSRGTTPTRCSNGVVQPTCAGLRLSTRHRGLWSGWICGQHLAARTSQQAFSVLAYDHYRSTAERDICRGGHGCGTSQTAACDRIKPRTGHCSACRRAYRGDRSSDTCRARSQGRRAPRDRPRQRPISVGVRSDKGVAAPTAR